MTPSWKFWLAVAAAWAALAVAQGALAARAEGALTARGRGGAS